MSPIKSKPFNTLIKSVFIILLFQVCIETLEEIEYINKHLLNIIQITTLFIFFIGVTIYCFKRIKNLWIRFLIPLSLFFLTLDPIIGVIEDFYNYEPIILFGTEYDYLDAIQDTLPMFIISSFLLGFYNLISQIEYQNSIIKTEMEKRDNELREKQRLLVEKDAAIQASQSKSQFLANMSHEIRTPLNGVLGMLELLKDTQLTDEQLENVKLAETSGKTLLNIVNDVLDYSKIEAGKLNLNLSEFSLIHAVQGILQTYSVQIKSKGLDYIQKLHPGLPAYVLGDEHRLNQVLINFISNAMKFTAEGRIEVNLQVTKEDARNCTIRFEVKDSGIGISPEMQKRIFDVFYQVENHSKQTYKGTGLGLAICSQLVKMMNGTIGVNSTIGEGSIFWFTVPFEKIDKPTGISDVEEQNLEDVHFEGSLLLVEDNPVNQKVATTMLSQMGFSVETADNGLIGYESFKERNYDIILMDCQMPVMDGYTAVKNIREWENNADRQSHNQTKRVPVLAMTAHALSGEKEKCISYGMDDYLPKPFTQVELIKMILHWLPHKVSTSIQTKPKSSRKTTPKIAIHSGKSIDVSYLDTIKTINPDKSLSILRTSIETYFDHSSKLLKEMKHSVFEKDYDTLSQIAHSLNSSSSHMGALSLSKNCQLLEQNANMQNLQECTSLVQKIQDEYEAVKLELRIILSTEESKEIETYTN